MTIGILAFQGNVREHEQAFTKLNVPSARITRADQIESLTHLIIPGGESTVISRFLQESGVGAIIQEQVRNHQLAILGTCAGAIILSTSTDTPERVTPLGLIDVTISRNAYGSQIHSFEEDIVFEPTGENVRAVFIRAPQIVAVGADVAILARSAGQPVLAQQGCIMASTFHPEYLPIPIVHRYFLSISAKDKSPQKANKPFELMATLPA